MAAAGSPDTPTSFEIRTADWLPVGEAQERVLRAAHPLPAEDAPIPLPEALGRALAEDETATATLPPWDNSAMDGYAARADDFAAASPSAPVALRVTRRVRAGDAPGPPVGPGEAVRIMTGAPVPPGADSVVRVEDTDRESEPGTVRVLRARDAGRNVRGAGEDMRLGDRVLAAGQAVTPGVVGVLAALGRADVFVHRRPRVAVVVTGDELRRPEAYDDVRAGLGVPESNGTLLGAALAAAGAEPVVPPIASDDEASLRGTVVSALDCDAIVTTGGASMGEADLVKRVLDAMGFEQDFWRTRIRPGSPFSFGHLPRDGAPPVPVFGLPGNPASAFVTYELFVRPFVLRLAGHRRVLRRRVVATAGSTLPGAPGLTFFLRVRLSPGAPRPTAVPTGPQGSGLVRSMAAADGLAVVPEEADGVAEGAEVEVILLDDAPAALAESAGEG